jgi:DNA processing protein
MSYPGQPEQMRAMSTETDGACRDCERRSWLLSKLSLRLDYRSRDESRLLELLELEDEQLIAAIAGVWREDLRRRWERYELDHPQSGRSDEPGEPGGPGEQCESGEAGGSGTTIGRSHGARSVDGAPKVEMVCRHCGDYPPMLGEHPGAPRMLHVVGGREHLRTLTGEPAVAIVGSERPTDYGMEMARSLARGLAASGVTVVSALANGIAAAAHAGALEVDRPTVMVTGGGVDIARPASRRGLYERVIASGCVVAELGCGFKQRRWCGPARARTVVGLAGLTIVVEADEGYDLVYARAAQRMRRTVAAVPGRVSSPVSRGTNALLMEGAPLVRDPEDALRWLYGIQQKPGGRTLEREQIAGPEADVQRRPRRRPARKLEPRLQTVLEQVGAGRDTPGKLTGSDEDPGETMLALTELELMGLLARGDGGRYVPCESLAGR